MFTYHFIEEKEKKEICSWKYPQEYAVYNLPSYEIMKKQQIGFCHPNKEKNFYTFYEGRQLIGFVNLLEEEKEVFVGIGVHPEFCSKGYGQKILKEAYRISKKLYPLKPLYLEVREWNQRAIHCYEKAGFCIEGNTYTQITYAKEGRFQRMVKQ